MNFSAIIAAGIMGIATLASQSDAFQVRFKPVEQQTREVSSQTPSQTQSQFQAVEITRILLSNGRATGFNQVTPRNGTEYRRGEEMSIYFEPRTLVTRYEEGHIRAAMTVDLEVRDADGKVIVNEQGAWKLPIAVKAPSHLPLSQLFAAMSTNPINLPAGRYQFKLRIHDDFGGTFTDRHVGITIVEAQASR
jgi:hypothetical protein